MKIFKFTDEVLLGDYYIFNFGSIRLTLSKFDDIENPDLFCFGLDDREYVNPYKMFATIEEAEIYATEEIKKYIDEISENLNEKTEKFL